MARRARPIATNAQLKLDDFAVEHYEHGLELGLPERAAEKARSFILSHVGQLAQLHLEGPMGTRVFVNGVDRGRLPLANFIYLVPGDARLSFVIDGRSRTGLTIETQAGHVVSMLVGETSLSAPPAPSISSPATAIVDSGGRVALGETRPSSRNLGTPQQKSEPSVPRRYRLIEWAVVASGATLAGLSTAYLPIAAARIASSRQALADACAVQGTSPDNCAHAKWGRQAEGQSASDSIATWKMARSVAWVGLGTGLAAAAFGAGLLTFSHADAAPHRKKVSIEVDPRLLRVTLAAEF